MYVYRGDSRGPKEIREAKGFHAWQPLTEVHARNLLRKFCGDETNLTLPPKIKTTVERLKTISIVTKKVAPLNPGDISRLIISQKTRDAVWISTAKDEDCGGYSSEGYVYRMKFNTLMNYKISTTTMGITVKGKSLIWPTLWLDRSAITGAAVVALEQRGSGREISFLTSIGLPNIDAYWPSGKVTPWVPFHRPLR